MTTETRLHYQTKQTLQGQHFIFHILEEDSKITIGLASDYVYPSIDRYELKDLADFIYKYLNKTKD